MTDDERHELAQAWNQPIGNDINRYQFNVWSVADRMGMDSAAMRLWLRLAKKMQYDSDGKPYLPPHVKVHYLKSLAPHERGK